MRQSVNTFEDSDEFSDMKFGEDSDLEEDRQDMRYSGSKPQSPEDEYDDEGIQGLLTSHKNSFAAEIKRLYSSRKCRYYYIAFGILATIMVTWILLVGSRVHQSKLFIFAEVFINVSLLMDFMLKLYITGPMKYFTSCANIFDSAVVVSCVTTFIIMMCTSSVSILTLEEVIEDMLFLLWCALQYLRIIMFFKHQKDAEDRSQRLDIKHFYADSIQNKEEKIFIDDIEFNKERDSDGSIGEFFKNKLNSREKRSSSTEEGYNSRGRDKQKLKSLDDNSIKYSDNF
ncbi:unnamed protein product [Moneuplotes crassus]|uniref:Ion transport domain-containing protein n=1 Tax=Euplotes crassus TaxID=5936 RepID=A0AAD1XIU3_EUPCR|nr:unnamed protein product [Moneuplotes crassus]